MIARSDAAQAEGEQTIEGEVLKIAVSVTSSGDCGMGVDGGIQGAICAPDTKGRLRQRMQQLATSLALRCIFPETL